MKKQCRSTTGEVLFEYEGLLLDAVNQFLYNTCWGEFSEERDQLPHFSLDLSQATKEDKHLEGFDGICQDLRGSNFSGTDLYWSAFREANLENINFSHCDLRGASFNNAILINANFENANMSFANIGGGADLAGANLTGANLQNVNLNGTQYDSKTIFPEGFIVPECMILRRDDESDQEFSKRAKEIKTKHYEEHGHPLGCPCLQCVPSPQNVESNTKINEK
ncbi:MAG: pentapeptide repeat-containing protein [Planctomycetaceae bacterium]|jgi:hypothetical protein|nr:pentapeptide repeat-containing protein [Planctomycetaceae bacterium]